MTYYYYKIKIFKSSIKSLIEEIQRNKHYIINHQFILLFIIYLNTSLIIRLYKIFI